MTSLSACPGRANSATPAPRGGAAVGLCVLFAAIAASACGGSPDTRTPVAPGPVTTGTPAAPATPAPVPASPAWDLEALGVPRFITRDYIDLARIERISRFRSGEGHDYSDDIESCRSMKHYFSPRAGSDAATIAIYSPVAGSVERVIPEWAGLQISIKSTAYPAFQIVLFHVSPSIPIEAGTVLDAGQRIGTHIGSQTSSDVAISVDAAGGRRLVSWFDAITDDLLQTYLARGVQSRERPIITRAERDASPLACSGGAFAGRGTIENWVSLK